MTNEPMKLSGCDVLPAIESSAPPADQRPEGAGRKGKSADKPKRGAGRFRVINAFADFTLAGLNRTEIVVWLLLWRDTKPDGLARTSQSDLARRGGCSDRNIRYALKRLRKAGLLTVAYQGGWNRGLSVYRVHPLDRQAVQRTPEAA